MTKPYQRDYCQLQSPEHTQSIYMWLDCGHDLGRGSVRTPMWTPFA